MTKPRTYLVRAHGGELAVPDVADVNVTTAGGLVLHDAAGDCVAAFNAVEWLSCLLAKDAAPEPDDGTEADADLPRAA
jgi:hypothetical protein